MPQNNKFQNRVIWITGASGGLGRELAISFAESEASLILSARNREKLLETQKLAKLSDEKCLILPLDLTKLDDETLKSLYQAIEQKFKCIDLLVHNASISQRSLANETTEAVEKQIMETIYFGPVKLTKYFIPLLQKSSRPKIAIISSLAGKFGVPLRSTYSAAKHALHGYFEAMRIELKSSIDIGFYILGGIKTDSAKNALLANGEINNRFDNWHQRNMPADKCADIIKRKVSGKRGEYIIGGFEKFGCLVRQFFPRLHQNILLKFFNREKKNFSD